MLAAFKGYERRCEVEQKRTAWLAWHIEALSRQRKIPPLNDLFGEKRKVKPQTPDEMLAALQAWANVTNRGL
jgi:hypothetical protein